MARKKRKTPGSSAAAAASLETVQKKKEDKSVEERIDAIWGAMMKKPPNERWTAVLEELNVFEGATTAVEKAYLRMRKAEARLEKAQVQREDLRVFVEAHTQAMASYDKAQERAAGTSAAAGGGGGGAAVVSDPDRRSFEIAATSEEAEECLNQYLAAAPSVFENQSALRDAIRRMNLESANRYGKIATLRMDSGGVSAIPFCAVLAPSGSGKTQSAFALPEAICLAMCEGTQKINSAMLSWNSVLEQCLELDVNERKNWSWHAMNLFPDVPLWTAGFFDFIFTFTQGEVGKHGAIAKKLAGYNETISFGRKSIRELRNAHRGRVVVLDEVPPVPHDNRNQQLLLVERMVKAARNILRRAHICVIMMGTHSSVTNLLKRAEGTRVEDRSYTWCYLICRLAPFSPSKTQRAVMAKYPETVQRAILTANPFFAKRAIEALAGAPSRFASTGQIFEHIRECVWNAVLKAKFALNFALANAGQKAMLQSVYNLDSNQEVTKLPPSLINGHFAQLLVDPSWKLTGSAVCMVPLLSNDSGVLRWVHESTKDEIRFLAVAMMPSPYDNPLMHFVLAGSASRGPFISERDGLPPPTLLSKFPELTKSDENGNNSTASTNWEAWESVGAAATVVASHMQPIGSSMSFDDWFLRLFLILQGTAVSDIGARRWAQNGAPSDLVQSLSLVRVPFLFGCGAHITQVEDVQPALRKRKQMESKPRDAGAGKTVRIADGGAAGGGAAAVVRGTAGGGAAAGSGPSESIQLGLCERLVNEKRMDGVIKCGEFICADSGRFKFAFDESRIFLEMKNVETFSSETLLHCLEKAHSFSPTHAKPVVMVVLSRHIQEEFFTKESTASSGELNPASKKPSVATRFQKFKDSVALYRLQEIATPSNCRIVPLDPTHCPISQKPSILMFVCGVNMKQISLSLRNLP